MTSPPKASPMDWCPRQTPRMGMRAAKRPISGTDTPASFKDRNRNPYSNIHGYTVLFKICRFYIFSIHQFSIANKCKGSSISNWYTMFVQWFSCVELRTIPAENLWSLMYIWPFFLMAACLVPAGIITIYLFARRIERIRLRPGHSA